LNKVYKLDKKLKKILEDFKRKEGNITILTGAGISAESGIPTFRGKEGYSWKRGLLDSRFK
jgi:NAD-dependent deacetylase